MIVLVEGWFYFPETSYLTWAKFSCCMISFLQNEGNKNGDTWLGDLHPSQEQVLLGESQLCSWTSFWVSYLVTPLQCHFPRNENKK